MTLLIISFAVSLWLGVWVYWLIFVFHSTLLETYPENYFVHQCFKIFLLTFLLAASKFVVFHLGLCSVVSLLLYNVKNEIRKSLYITWETGFLSIICRKKTVLSCTFLETLCISSGMLIRGDFWSPIQLQTRPDPA